MSTREQTYFMGNAVGELRSANLQAMAEWVLWSSAESSTAAIKKVINDSGKRIQKLEDDIDAVSAGTYSFDKWRKRATAELDLYQGQGSVFSAMKEGDYSFGRFWNEVIEPTATEVKDTATDIATNVNEGFPWLIVGLVAVAVIVVFK